VTDFVEDVFFYYTTQELKENYEKMVKMLEMTMPTLPPEVFKVIRAQSTCRKAMQLMMIYVLVMDDTNGLARYALANTTSIARLQYFRQMVRKMMSAFLQPQQMGDTRIPEPTNLLGVLRAEYMSYRDHYGRFAAEYAKPATNPNVAHKANDLPQDGNLGRGT